MAVLDDAVRHDVATAPEAKAAAAAAAAAGVYTHDGQAQPSATVTGETASEATEPGDTASDANAPSQAEPGWGVSYGFDRDVELPGDAAIVDHASEAPGWGATHGAGEVREVGPFFDALDQAASAVDTLQALLEDRSIPVADLAAATVSLHKLACRVQAAHLAAVGQTVAANALPEGSPTANAWISASHRLDSSRASKARNDAAWLADHPRVAESLAAGLISVDHVTVMRTVSEANTARREAFGDFEAAAIAAAILTDPAGLRAIMNLWATAVDPDTADDDADDAYERRKLFLDRLGDRWIIHGELPDDMGARLAGALNAYMEHLRAGYTNGDGIRVPGSARRADALDALVQTAIAKADAAATGSTAVADSHSTEAQLVLDTDDTSADASGDAAATADTRDSDTDTDNADDAHDPVAPSGPGDPFDPSNPGGPSNPGDPSDPSNPGDPFGRGDPSDPSGPSDPSDPSDPSNPFGPGESGDPVGPSDPSNPSGPFDPGGSGASGGAIALPPTALTRAQVMITVPIATLHTCAHCRGNHDPATALAHILTGHHTCHTDNCDTGTGSGTRARTGAGTPGVGADARDTITAALATGATWSVGNGPGTGTCSPAMARYATCDGEITRLIVNPASRPLNLGRTQRVVPLALRRALEVRDRGCIIPGCDRPAGWCHAHHITHWADGGETDLPNLALLCQHHHTELHLGHWHITMRNGTPKATLVPPYQRAQYRRNQRTAQANRPATTPRRT